jgi:acetyl-CoA carboxylase carboxyltransferase component
VRGRPAAAPGRGSAGPAQPGDDRGDPGAGRRTGTALAVEGGEAEGRAPAAYPGRTETSNEVFVHAGPLYPGGSPVVRAEVQHSERDRALSGEGAAALARAAELARERRLPLVTSLFSSGPDLGGGVEALDGWGRVARAFASCSGVVPVIAIVDGPLLSGPALLLGMVDAVMMTSRALAYVSGPAAVAEVTGVPVRPVELGGASVHAARSGLATIVVPDSAGATEAASQLLSFLPAHCDELPPLTLCTDPDSRSTPELRHIVPASATGSYDVRSVIGAIADDGETFELRADWAPQFVTALVRLAGQPVGVLANQPQAMAGTLDIAASQKGARFVEFCDSFNLPLLTIVDTPGFMPGRDLEWRGMIRHGAELVFAYAEATVPRVCLVVRKAYGGAYIVMDSKAMGNDVCIAWPTAELAVLGAEAAVRIVHRREDEVTRARLAEEYRERFLNPYIAAERGYVDLVIDPADTRQVLSRCFQTLQTKRERLVRRKHGNGPL